MIALAAVSVGTPASAEVADKLPSAAALWIWAAALTLAALLLERVRPRLGLLVLPLAALFAWAEHAELTDPQVGPAIVAELGRGYVRTSYAGHAAGLAAPLLAVLSCSLVRRRRARVARAFTKAPD